MTTLRPFTREDWDVWGGARSAPNAEPCIAYFHTLGLEGAGGAVIVDADGVSVVFWDDESYTTREYALEKNYSAALVIAALLPTPPSDLVLRSLGFRKAAD